MHIGKYELHSSGGMGGGGAGGTGGAGGAGGAGGGGAGGGGTVQPPWGTDVSARWNIGDKPWFEHLPDGPSKELYRQKNYANPVVAADSYYSLNKLNSTDPSQVIYVPKADASDADFAVIDQKLGRPDKPDAYDFKFADTVTVDEATMKWGKQLAYDLGLPPRKAQKMAEAWNKFQSEQITAAEQRMKDANAEAVASFKTTWGAVYDENVAAGRRALDALKLPAETVAGLERNIGAAPVIELLARLGKATAEGSFKDNGNSGGDPNNPDTMTPDRAAEVIKQLRNDAEFNKAYIDRAHPGHKDAVERMNKLYKTAGNKIAS